MKKTFYIASAAVAVLAMASCSSDKKTNNQVEAQPVVENVTEVYSGILPAADADGFQYTLVLDYDADDNFAEGDFDLTQTVVAVDSTSTTGFAATDQKFVTKGDFDVFTKDGKKYLKLTSDANENDITYFQVTSDSTVILVNIDLEQPAVPGLNYTLTKVK